MRISPLGRSVAVALLAVAPTLPAAAQQTIGVSTTYLGYKFNKGLGADVADLLLMPVAVRLQAGRALSLDVYAAWAQGQVERDHVTYSLSGLTDTRVKLTLQATPWVLLAVGASLPTGESTHNPEQAVVASVLSADLLGFPESNWGTGLGVTSSLATAVRAGQFGLGVAASYSYNGQFEPSATDAVKYQPGNETRVRVGLDRNIGTSTLTMGGTFMTYASDQAAGRNLFQAGNRMRFDATYQFRAGAGVWTMYAVDLWRQKGDLTLPFIDNAGSVVGDTTYATPSQNLVVAGFQGSVGLVGRYVFRPTGELRLQNRKGAGGSDEGSGWIAAGGGDFPLRLFGAFDFFPRVRVLYGVIKDPIHIGRRTKGLELSGTLRVGF
jgi:hypothetical protein